MAVHPMVSVPVHNFQCKSRSYTEIEFEQTQQHQSKVHTIQYILRSLSHHYIVSKIPEIHVYPSSSTSLSLKPQY